MQEPPTDGPATRHADDSPPLQRVSIRTRNNGPFVVEGPVTIVDAQGNPFTISTDKPAIALCRCGHSGKKPFCDGSHNRCGFIAEESARETR